jgi:MerR family transcriptional regulator, light-induced transcriptional regulator
MSPAPVAHSRATLRLTPMNDRTKPSKPLTIGALARATGVPVETLRTWERRYGFPAAERTGTGHRRYAIGMVERVRMVRSALKLGHRPSVALTSSELQLRALLEQSQPLDAAAPSLDQERVADWLELIRCFDGRALDRELRLSMATIGADRFLAQRAAPLIHEIGERWSRGELGVRHEHFASERLNDFFAQYWQPLNDAASGPAAICATPAGERHSLGLQMATLTLALNNVRVVYLGADTPAPEIVESVAQQAARAIVLSAAIGVGRERLQAECALLRSALGPAFPIVVGGRGFEPAPREVTRLESLAELNDWARTFAAGATKPIQA